MEFNCDKYLKSYIYISKERIKEILRELKQIYMTMTMIHDLQRVFGIGRGQFVTVDKSSVH